jgi:hypothetical protein
VDWSIGWRDGEQKSERRFFLRASTGVVLAGSAAGLLAACSAAAPVPIAAAAAVAAAAKVAPTVATTGGVGIKVGVLNSLSGTMAISEVVDLPGRSLAASNSNWRSVAP